VVSSGLNSLPKAKPAPGAQALPEEMSSSSLFGGALIAGDALAAPGRGIAGLLTTLLAG